MCDELRDHYRETAVWNVTDEVLAATSLQSLVRCAVDNDTILRSTHETDGILSETIVVNASITITAGSQLLRNPSGEIEEISPKYSLTCPDNTHGVFDVR